MGLNHIHFFGVIMVLTRTDKAVTVTINIPVLRNSVEFTLVELSIKYVPPRITEDNMIASAMVKSDIVDGG